MSEVRLRAPSSKLLTRLMRRSSGYVSPSMRFQSAACCPYWSNFLASNFYAPSPTPLLNLILRRLRVAVKHLEQLRALPIHRGAIFACGGPAVNTLTKRLIFFLRGLF